MSTIIEQCFKNSFYVGKYYVRFKILIVLEANAFREPPRSRKDFTNILDAFNAAIEELEINLGEDDRAEFFAYYAYYWWNRSDIGYRTIDSEEALTDVINRLGANLIVSAGGVGDNRFRDKERVNRFDFNRPIFIEARSEGLKEIFKAYLKNCHSEFNATIEEIADQISEGLSPLEAFDDVCGAGTGTFNTYPIGTPTNILYPYLLAICEEPHTLEKILAHIYKWLNDTERLFRRRQVVLFTDKWLPETFSRYQKAFKRWTRRGVTFDIRLSTDGGAVKIPVFG